VPEGQQIYRVGGGDLTHPPSHPRRIDTRSICNPTETGDFLVRSNSHATLRIGSGLVQIDRARLLCRRSNLINQFIAGVAILVDSPAISYREGISDNHQRLSVAAKITQRWIILWFLSSR
jgi:hypothetical protein